MLVLSRKPSEIIRIGEDIQVMVVELRKGYVRLGVTAPKDVPIHRQEVYDEIKRDQDHEPE